MRRRGLGALVAAFAVAMFALVGMASATPPKSYLVQFPTAPIVPTSAGTATFSVVATNETVNTAMGGINFIMPSGLTVLSVNAQAPTSVSGVTWTASIPASGCVVPQTHSGHLPCVNVGGTPIGNKQRVTVTITVAAPLVCDGASYSYAWQTDARQDNSFSGTGNVLYPETTNALWNTTTAVQDPTSSANQLVFTQQPNNAQVGQPITGNSYAAGPAVAVSAENACGAVDTSYNTPISITDTPPSYVTNSALSGGGAVTPTNGVATFANLVVNKADPTNISSAAGQGYTLTAASGSLASATSGPFDISDGATPCIQAQGGAAGSCTTTENSPTNAPSTSSVTVVGTGDPTNGNNSQLTENVDSGNALSCSFGSGVPVDSNWYQYNLNNTTWSKQLTYDLVPTTKTNHESVGDLQVCFGSTTDFVTSNGAMAGAATLPDGTSGFVGFLPNCTTKNGSPTPGATYCIQSRSKVTAVNPFGFDFQVVINSPAGVPGDPWLRS